MPPLCVPYGRWVTHLVYVIGAPGVGKSMLMNALTGSCWREPCVTGVPHSQLWTPSQQLRERGAARCLALELGRRRAEFSGTDALSLSIQPRAVAWLATHPHDLVLGEGDRLGNLSFLEAMRGAGVRVTLVHVGVNEEVLLQRWAAARAAQDPAWRAGRRTKAHNTAHAWADGGGEVHFLDASTDTPLELAARLRQLVPALAVLPPWTLGEPLPPQHLCREPHTDPLEVTTYTDKPIRPMSW